MRKAIIVLATTVAFLLSGVAFAATRKNVNVPDTASILKGNGPTLLNDGILSSVGSVIEGEYIPAGGKTTAISVRPKAVIPISSIGAAIKNGLRANAAGIAVTATVGAAVSAVGWVMQDGVLMKKTTDSSGSPTPVSTNPDAGEYYWQAISLPNISKNKYSSPQLACMDAASHGYWASGTYVGIEQSYPTQFTCTVRLPDGLSRSEIVGYGSSCPSGSNYSPSTGSCLADSKSVPVTDADFDVLDGFVRTQDGAWQRQAAQDVCDNSSNPSSCYKALSPSTSLTGPDTIQLPSTTSTSGSITTNPDGTTSSTGTITTTQTPSISITYGDTYYDYTTNNTTTTTNPDGTTTTTTETSDAPPDVPDALAGINDPLGGIPDEIKNQGSSGASLPYHSWFNMGGSCKEHSFELPVIGTLTTNYCPIHEKYVRPFLYFMFAFWTWHSCFAIWRENVKAVRAH